MKYASVVFAVSIVIFLAFHIGYGYGLKAQKPSMSLLEIKPCETKYFPIIIKDLELTLPDEAERGKK